MNSEQLVVTIPENIAHAIENISAHVSDNFLELVDKAKLDKHRDFVGASFDQMNLDGLQLEGYNFTDADFRNCSHKGTIFSDCELAGAAFSFPPTIRDRWQRRKQIFIGQTDDRTLELMRVVLNAGRKEDRKEAVQQLLNANSTPQVKLFLQNVCLEDKAKSLRDWLRTRLTRGFRDQAAHIAILERSLFSSTQNVKDDLEAYVKLTDASTSAVATICHACATNSSAIRSAAKLIGSSPLFGRALIQNVLYSDSHQVWYESSLALAKSSISAEEKREAFLARLYNVDETYELSRLSTAAAYNQLKIDQLFTLCAKSYAENSDPWSADDFLLYCYYYDKEMFEDDVLYYSFATGRQRIEEIRNTVSATTAFEAYCFVHAPKLYQSAIDFRGHFYFDPRRFVGIHTSDVDEIDPFYPPVSPDVLDAIKTLALSAFDSSKNVELPSVRKP